jgi:outer membrane receptor protein involved in Fe transport
MKINFQNKHIAFLLLLSSQLTLAQKKDETKKKEETIGTEEVNVVKAYLPTISDAFKVKEIPSLNDEGNAPKETIKYTIFSFPVASTFTPSKGNAQGVDKAKKEHLFTNYATAGVGNYGNLNAELFVAQELGNNDYVAGMFKHQSSQGGIKGIDLNDKFYDTSLDVIYGVKNRDMSWSIDLGYQNQIYNWYGLPVDFGSTLTPQDRGMLLSSISPKHSYNGINLGGNIDFSDGIFTKASMKYSHFSDGLKSSENRFYIKPSFKVEIMDQSINTDVIVDYVGGSFENNYEKTNLQPIKYGFTNFGLSPSFVMQQDDWTLNLGAKLFYSLDNENSNSKILVYPNVTASYKVVGDLMIFYAGAEGNLEQNTYMDFVDQNPFLSPTLNINPTDKQFDIFAGLKGKLANNVSYKVQGSYVNERNKALFKSNNYTEDIANENYAFGNSFQIVYDDMTTMRFYGELKADFSENVSFGINGTFNSYSNDHQSEAWNLPTMKLSTSLDFNVTKQWYAGFNLFYVGERKDEQVNTSLGIDASPITLKSYFDLNAHVGYKYSERLTFYLKANNITNQAYQRWLNYPVQGFQIMAGANYKFDF